MPTNRHFRNSLLTVKTDDPDEGGQLRMFIEDNILKQLGDATGALILSTAPNGDVQRYLADHPDAPLHTRAKWVSN